MLQDTSGKEGSFCTTVQVYSAKNSKKTFRISKTLIVFLSHLLKTKNKILKNLELAVA